MRGYRVFEGDIVKTMEIKKAMETIQKACKYHLEVKRDGCNECPLDSFCNKEKAPSEININKMFSGVENNVKM